MSETILFRPKSRLMYFDILKALIYGLIPAVISYFPLQYALGSQNLFAILYIALFIFLFIALPKIAYTLTLFPTIQYELTPSHLVSSQGIVTKVKRSTPLDKITNVDVVEGPLDLFLGVGQVWIFTPSTGSENPEVTLIGIQNPHALRELITSRAEQAKSTAQPTSVQNSSGFKSNDSVGNNAVLQEILKTLRNIEDLLKER